MNSIDVASSNPFLRYRRMLDSYRRASASGWSDADFVALVERLQDSVREIDGRGFEVTPLFEDPETSRALGLPTERLWIKDDTNNVGGSHKARHLFGVMLHQALDNRDRTSELAIASCGNAALAAAVVARAEERPLRVFIPTWAEPAIVEELERLDAPQDGPVAVRIQRIGFLLQPDRPPRRVGPPRGQREAEVGHVASALFRRECHGGHQEKRQRPN